MSEQLQDSEIVALVGCGLCGAAQGARCVDTRTGRLTQRPHPSRREDGGHGSVGEVPDPDLVGEHNFIMEEG